MWENIKRYENEIKTIIPASLYDRWAADVVSAFFWSWTLDYFNPQNKKNFSQKLKEMRDVVKSNFFQEALRSTNLSLFPPITKIEVTMLKFFPSVTLFLHLVKNYGLFVV